jgi:hypothetical protein
MSRKAQLPFRTTLSLPLELGQQIESIANRRGVSLVEVAREAIEHHVRIQNAEEAEKPGDPVVLARRILEDATRLENPYQALVASWRLSRAQRQVEGIAASKLEIDLWPGEIYLLRILTELLQNLEARDSMYVVSNLHFWKHGDGSLLTRDSTTHYLTAQEQAIRRGIRLRRVFLLGPAETNAPELLAHAEFLRRARSVAADSEQVSVKFRVFDNVENALLQYGHFACLRRLGTEAEPVDEGCMVAEPIYYGPAKQVHLRLLFSRGSGTADALTKSYIDRFLQADEGARPIEELTGG